MYQKILHLIHTPRFAGAEILVRDLCLAHKEKGIKSAIASIAPAENDFLSVTRQLEDNDVKLFFPDTKLVMLQRSCFYNDTINSFKPDVVYGHSVLPSIYGRLAKIFFNRGVKFIPILHSACMDDYRPTDFYLSELFLSLFAYRVFSVSNEGKENYCKHFPWKKKAVDVVPNGINLEKIYTAREERARLRTQYNLKDENKVLIQVGRISDIKQQLFSLEALTPILRNNPGTEIWFAGIVEEQDYNELLKARIVELGLEGQVKILGGRQDIPELLSAADVYLMPSKKESQGIAMLEALASGLPIVASSIQVFQYLKNWPGVSLVSASSKDEFLQAVLRMLNGPERFDWNLDTYDISRTAAVYGGYNNNDN